LYPEETQKLINIRVEVMMQTMLKLLGKKEVGRPRPALQGAEMLKTKMILMQASDQRSLILSWQEFLAWIMCLSVCVRLNAGPFVGFCS
jgi:hypothetical protein